MFADPRTTGNAGLDSHARNRPGSHQTALPRSCHRAGKGPSSSDWRWDPIVMVCRRYKSPHFKQGLDRDSPLPPPRLSALGAPRGCRCLAVRGLWGPGPQITASITSPGGRLMRAGDTNVNAAFWTKNRVNSYPDFRVKRECRKFGTGAGPIAPARLWKASPRPPSPGSGGGVIRRPVSATAPRGEKGKEHWSLKL